MYSLNRSRFFDTNKLIENWRRCKGDRRLADVSSSQAIEWAGKLIGLYQTDAILTPVRIEFLCGVMSSQEKSLGEAYLSHFYILDRGEIRDEDWVEATRYAQWVTNPPARRSMGDCLIAAIARRLRIEIISGDSDLIRGIQRSDTGRRS